jgi:hypothetical protein
MKNKEYCTVGTIPKYCTVGTIPKYCTVGTIPKSNIHIQIWHFPPKKLVNTFEMNLTPK